jgi:hypothetical protein
LVGVRPFSFKLAFSFVVEQPGSCPQPFQRRTLAASYRLLGQRYGLNKCFDFIIGCSARFQLVIVQDLIFDPADAALRQRNGLRKKADPAKPIEGRYRVPGKSHDISMAKEHNPIIFDRCR